MKCYSDLKIFLPRVTWLARLGKPAWKNEGMKVRVITKFALEPPGGICPMKPIHILGILLAASTLQAQTLNQAAATANPPPVNYVLSRARCFAAQSLFARR
jgi:hypothetical protein